MLFRLFDAGNDVSDYALPTICNTSSVICDRLLLDAWFRGSQSAFKDLLWMLKEKTMPVDYRHSKTGVTLLMAGSIHGNVVVVKAAISFGANPALKVFTAFCFFYYYSLIY